MGVNRESDPWVGVPESSSDLSGAEDALVEKPTGVEMPEVMGAVEGNPALAVEMSLSEAAGQTLRSRADKDERAYRSMLIDLWKRRTLG